MAAPVAVGVLERMRENAPMNVKNSNRFMVTFDLRCVKKQQKNETRVCPSRY